MAVVKRGPHQRARQTSTATDAPMLRTRKAAGLRFFTETVEQSFDSYASHFLFDRVIATLAHLTSSRRQFVIKRTPIAVAALFSAGFLSYSLTLGQTSRPARNALP